jgi:hypothetical protein
MLSVACDAVHLPRPISAGGGGGARHDAKHVGSQPPDLRARVFGRRTSSSRPSYCSSTRATGARRLPPPPRPFPYIPPTAAAYCSEDITSRHVLATTSLQAEGVHSRDMGRGNSREGGGRPLYCGLAPTRIRARGVPNQRRPLPPGAARRPLTPMLRARAQVRSLASSRTDWTRLVPRPVLTGHVWPRAPVQVRSLALGCASAGEREDWLRVHPPPSHAAHRDPHARTRSR